MQFNHLSFRYRNPSVIRLTPFSSLIYSTVFYSLALLSHYPLIYYCCNPDHYCTILYHFVPFSHQSMSIERKVRNSLSIRNLNISLSTQTSRCQLKLLAVNSNFSLSIQTSRCQIKLLAVRINKILSVNFL